LSKIGGGTYENEAVASLLFMARLLFIIAQIFKRGVEIQTDNELTI